MNIPSAISSLVTNIVKTTIQTLLVAFSLAFHGPIRGEDTGRFQIFSGRIETHDEGRVTDHPIIVKMDTSTGECWKLAHQIIPADLTGVGVKAQMTGWISIVPDLLGELVGLRNAAKGTNSLSSIGSQLVSLSLGVTNTPARVSGN